MGRRSIRSRYRQLNIWNKFFVWCGVVTIVGFLIAVAAFTVNLQFGPSKKNQLQALQDHKQIVRMLRDELAFKGKERLIREHMTGSPIDTSRRARELAGRITRNDPAYAQGLKRIAEGDYEDARDSLENALGDNEVEAAYIYSALGLIELYSGNDEEAVLWNKRAMAVGPGLHDIQSAAALIYVRAEHFGDAEACIHELLAENDGTGDHEKERARMLGLLGHVYYKTFRLREAKAVQLRAVEISSVGPSEMADACNSIGMTCLALNEFNDAERFISKALELEVHTSGTHLSAVAIYKNNLGLVYAAEERWQEALSLIVDAKAIDKKLYGEKHPRYASRLNNLGKCYEGAGEFAKAENLISEALRIVEEVAGHESADALLYLGNVAQLYSKSERLEEAEALYRQLVDSEQTVYGQNHPFVSQTLNNLALLYLDMGRRAEAVQLLTAAAEKVRAYFQKDHPELLPILSNLAYAYSLEGRGDEAQKLLQSNLTMSQEYYGIGSPQVGEALMHFAAFYAFDERADEEERCLQRAHNVLGLHYPGTHPRLKQIEKRLAQLEGGKV